MQPTCTREMAADGPLGRWYASLGAQCDKSLRMSAGGDAMASRREDGGCGGADSSNNREGVQEGDAVAAPHPAPGGSTRHCRVSAPRDPPRQGTSCNLQSPYHAAVCRRCKCSCRSLTIVGLALARRYDGERGLRRSLAAFAPNGNSAHAGGWLRRQHSRRKDILSASTVLPGELQLMRAVVQIG